MALRHESRFAIDPSAYQVIWDRDGQGRGLRTGGVRHCSLEGCGSMRLGVRWPDGRLTWPCAQSLQRRSDGDWQIA